MPIPDYQTIMLPLLKICASGLIEIKDARDSISSQFKLTDEEKKIFVPSGSMPLINNRVSWASTYLVAAKLLDRPKRGFYTITERGKKVLGKSPDKIDINFLNQFDEFVEFRKYKKEKKDEKDTELHDILSTPDEKIGAAYEEIRSDVENELLSRILNGTPEFFEKLITQLLVSMGYGGADLDSGTHLGKSGDGGVDGVINEDLLGLDKIYIQAKRYTPDSIIGRPDIQKFAGSLIGFGATKGVFVTTSSFSKHADEYAQGVPQSIILINGKQLTSLMLDHNVGTRTKRTIEIKAIDEDFFLEE